MTKNLNCLHCFSVLTGDKLYLGMLPVCNRFQSTSVPSNNNMDLSLTQCKLCGLIQILSPPPVSFLVPRIPWLRYNEPENHLENLVEKLILSGLSKKSTVCSIGPFDAPLLSRLKHNTAQIDCVDLLGDQKEKEGFYPYLETIQSKISPINLSFIKKTYDLVICRYLLEHCHDPVSALKGLKSLVSKGGQILIEVPDSSKFLSLCDYSFIWEEHTQYFTKSSLINLLSKCGFYIKNLWQYDSQLEDALVAIVEINPILLNPCIKPNFDLFELYSSQFLNVKEIYQYQFFKLKHHDKKIVIFGAGHQSTMFVNVLNISSSISFVLDDDVNKQGCFLPGTNIPIVPSSVLFSNLNINICLLAIHPRLEEVIQKKFNEFIKHGGKMYSIFHGSHMPKLLEIPLCA